MKVNLLVKFFNPVVTRLLRTEIPTIIVVIFLSLCMTLIDAVTISILPALLNLIQDISPDKLPTVLKIWIELLYFLPANEQIIVLLFGIVAGIIVKNILYGISLYISYSMNARLGIRLRREVFELLTTRTQQYFHDTNTGNIIELVMSQPGELGHLGRSVADFLINVISLVVYVGLLFILSIEMALATIVFSLVSVGIVTFYNRLAASYTNRWTESRYRLSQTMVEAINGMMTIKLFNKTSDIIEKVNRQNEIERYSGRMRFFAMMMSAPLTEILGTIFIGFIIIWTTSTSSLDSGANLSVLLAFIVVMVRMLVPLKEVNRSRSLIISHWAVIDKLFEMIQETALYEEASGEAELGHMESEIYVEDVSFSYFNAPEPVLKNISLQLPKRQLIVIIGQSGSGKSTLVNLLLNLYQPQSGRILIDNQDIQSVTQESLRERITYVQQSAFLFDDTVANNIKFGVSKGKHATQAEVEMAAKVAVAHDFIMELPSGYETLIGERGTSLSGGQTQRLALARGFIRSSDILILDESTSALDQLTEKTLFENIETWRRNRTVLVITHRIELANLADWLIVLSEGKVVRQGRPDVLKDENGEFSWLYQYVDPVS